MSLKYTTPRGNFFIDVRTSISPSAVRTLASLTDLRPIFEKRHQRWDITTQWRFSRAFRTEFAISNLTNDSFLDTWQGGRETSAAPSHELHPHLYANLDNLRLPLSDADPSRTAWIQ